MHNSTTEAKAEVVKPDGHNEEAGWAVGWGTFTEGPVTLRLLSTFQLDTTREEGGVQACVCIHAVFLAAPETGEISNLLLDTFVSFSREQQAQPPGEHGQWP